MKYIKMTYKQKTEKLKESILNFGSATGLKVIMKIVKLKETYSSELSKKLDITYSHTVRIIQVLEELGFIKYNRSKSDLKHIRRHYFIPTKECKIVGEYLLKIEQVFKNKRRNR